MRRRPSASQEESPGQKLTAGGLTLAFHNSEMHMPMWMPPVCGVVTGAWADSDSLTPPPHPRL